MILATPVSTHVSLRCSVLELPETTKSWDVSRVSLSLFTRTFFIGHMRISNRRGMPTLHTSSLPNH